MVATDTVAVPELQIVWSVRGRLLERSLELRCAGPSEMAAIETDLPTPATAVDRKPGALSIAVLCHGEVQSMTKILDANTITDAQIREAYRDGIISYDLLEFATFPAWKATQRYYRERCAEILNAARADQEAS